MLQDIIVAGTTSYRGAVVRVVDSTDGTPETGVDHATTGIALWYRKIGGAKVAITPAALAAVDSAYSSGGFKHISDGYCRLDLPNAALDTEGYVDFGGSFTGMIVMGGRIKVMSATRGLSGTALPDAAASAAGGLITSGTGTGQISLSSGAVTLPSIPANWITSAGINAAALNGKGDWNVGKTGYSLTATTGLGNQTANITGNLSGSVGSVTAPVLLSPGTGTGQILLNSGAVTAGTVSDKGGYSLVATTGLGNQTANITGNLSGSVGSVTGAVGSVTGAVGSVGSGGITSASFASGAINAAAIAADAIGASELATDAVTEIANAVAALTVEGSLTLQNAVKLILAAAAGKVSGADGTTITIRDTTDTYNRIQATVDQYGNRSAVSYVTT